MKTQVLFFLLSITTFVLSAQTKQPYVRTEKIVDRTPIFKNCTDEISDEEKVICTDDSFMNYMLEYIDEDVCPTTDSTSLYSFNFIVTEQGKITQPKVTNKHPSSDCTKYFEFLLDSLASDYKMIPAILNGENVSFRKRFKFNYPDVERGLSSSETDTSLIFKVVEQMPRFAACEEMIASVDDKHTCAQGELLTFIYRNLKYPAEARSKGVEGMVVAQFVIDTSGHLQNIEIIREIGGGCEDAVLDVFNLMNQLNPPFVSGEQGGKKVKVLYTMPVKFKLESNSSKFPLDKKLRLRRGIKKK